MDPSEATWSLSHVHPLSRFSFSDNSSTHGTENPLSFPIWRTAGYDTSLFSEGRTTGESADRVGFPNGRAISLSTRYPVMTTISGRGINLSEISQALGSTGFDGPVNELIGGSGRAIAAGDMNRFSQAPLSYIHTQVPGTFVSPCNLVQRYNADHSIDNDRMYEANTLPNYGAAITSSRSHKRKFSAVECPMNGAPGFSTDISHYSRSYDPLLSHSANNDRIPFGPSNSISFSEFLVGGTVVPLPEMFTGSRIPSLEESHVHQDSGFPRDVRNSWESLRGSHALGTSNPGSTQNRSFVPQVQLWVPERRQEGVRINNLNLTSAEFSDSISSIDWLSGRTYEGRQSELLRVQGNEIDNSYLMFRRGQGIASNRNFSEEFRPVGSSQNYISNGYDPESRPWMNPEFHSMTSTSALPQVSLTDNCNGRRAFYLPWAENMQRNHLPIQSTTLLPSAAPGRSMVMLPDSGGTDSSSDLFQTPVVQSSFEYHGDDFLSGARRMPVGIPVHRLYRPHDSYNYCHRNISNGMAEGTPTIQHDQRIEESRYEQLLILDPAVPFGDIELQDQHSDWRLDVDNMSYEELLALEERIGNVCTGVSEDALSKKLKIVKYSSQHETATASQGNEAKCSICQEEYEEGDDLGRLKCGHSYHAVCIKQWLVNKNQCPVCKASAFSS